MSDTGAAELSPRERPAGSGPIRLAAGDYVGAPAAQAAQGVRRAGLRPGLERSFGCEAELTGLVVAQDPPAGRELARNAMVTLYVAAPGPGPTSELEKTREHDVTPPGGDAPLTEPAGFMFAPPDPPAPERPAGGVAEPQPAGRPDLGGEHEARGPRPSEEELTSELQNVLAGEASERWRRHYPRKPVTLTLRGAFRWAVRHPVRVLAVACVLVALAGGFAHQRSSRAPVALGPPPAPALMQPPGRTAGRSPHRTRRVEQWHRSPRRRGRRARRASAAARGTPPIPARVGQPQASPPPPGGEASAGSSEQARGGPFSP